MSYIWKVPGPLGEIPNYLSPWGVEIQTDFGDETYKLSSTPPELQNNTLDKRKEGTDVDKT